MHKASFFGIIGVIVAIIVMAVLAATLTVNIPPTEIDLDDEQITVAKGDYSKTVLLEDIVSVEYDPDSILVVDANRYTTDSDGNLQWESIYFEEDFCKITGHKIWHMNSTNNDDCGEGKESSRTVKVIGATGSDLFIIFDENPSLITIKTSYDRYLFFNAVSEEETLALYEQIKSLVGEEE